MLQERRGQVLNNEHGAEIAEVGIWLALIVAISIAIIAGLGTKIQQAFTKVQTEMNK
jgi:Flp pilus assembly pilin Flp